MLPRGPRGQVDAGLGKGIARGTPGLIAPTQSIVQPVEEHTIDGVKIIFQLAPETEAPAEMHMFYPQLRVLNMAENACPLLHNFIPLRGAVARDPRIWAKYIGDAIALYAPATEILIGQHHWPTWGREAVLDHLESQRDLYKHIHDQTLRLMNKGWRPAEIAEAIDLPPGLAERWSARGYYGSVNHNVKAVYQRYLSWYDANPCNLHPLPPARAAAKLVDYMGGAAAAIARAKADFAKGEYRWVAQVMKEVVYAEPANIEARALCADALEQMGYQAEFGDLAQRLPVRRPGAAPWRVPAAGAGQHGRRHAGRTDQRRLLRHDGDPPRPGEGCRPVDGDQLAFYRSQREAGAHPQKLHLESSPGRVVGRGGRLYHHDARHARCHRAGQTHRTGCGGIGRPQDRGRSLSSVGAVRHVRTAGGPHVRHPHSW